jgi:NAD(P)-dependent dehydrogenase (short-subunit alcohol dehydrogenase family)
MRGLRDRVAIVTGAANGIGAATTRRLHQEGAKVALLDVDQTGGKALADRLGAERALFVACDVTVEEQVAAAVGATVDHFGGVDVLVNNAGVNARSGSGSSRWTCGRAGCAAGRCCRTCGAGGAG